jgi:predicted outer membrane protein
MLYLGTPAVRTAAALCTVAVLSLGTSGCMMGGMALSPEMRQSHMAVHAFTMATHMGEIEEAQLALSKSQNPQVRDLAQRMVTEHTAAMQRAQQMMMRLGMTMDGDAAMATGGTMDMERMRAMLMENRYSRPVMESHMQAMQMLRGLDGMRFDQAYMQRQVAAHSYALENLDRMMSHMGMMPDGSMAAGMNDGSMNMEMDLPATAEGVMMLHMRERAMIADHLRMAQQMAGSMRSM